jgi:8-hydroxy-5-deazaflavin:NADPH oxidoreductase
MNIGILGAGRMATALGSAWTKEGHRVTLSFSRDPAKLDEAASAIGGRAATPDVAVRDADVIVLATGWDGAAGALSAAGNLDGRVVWSIVNPMKPDFSGLAVGTDTSGSEIIAGQLGKAAFVAAWPPFAEVLATGSTHFGSGRANVFMCGESSEAKQTIAPLLAAIDVTVVDAGPLRAARFIEPALMLLVHLAYGERFGLVALDLLRR